VTRISSQSVSLDSGDVPDHPLDGGCHRRGDASGELDEALRWDRTEGIDGEDVPLGFDSPWERHIVGLTRDRWCDERSVDLAEGLDTVCS